MEKFGGIILAAGLSSRFPEWKLDYKLNGQSLFYHSISHMAPSVDKIVVVGGFNFDIIKHKLTYYEKNISNKTKLIFNKNYNNGNMFESVILGVKNIKSQYIFIVPADMPFIKTYVYETLKLFKEMADVVIPSYNKKGGHPILISQNVKKAILKADNSTTLKDVINRFRKKYVEIDDKGIIIDIDSKNDIDNLITLY